MDFGKSYFEIFDLPVSFNLDLDQLGTKYRQLQSSVHPDRDVEASAQEKRLSLQGATKINTASDVLKSGLSRAIYLLELSGIDVTESPELDPAFLMEQIELRERLEDISEGDDGALEQLDGFKAEIEELARSLEAQFAGEFETDPGSAEGVVHKLQFIDKLLVSATKLEEKLLDY